MRFIALLLLLAPILSNSQEAVTTTKDSIKSDVPVAINVVNIIEEVRSTSNELKLIKKKASPSKRLITIDTSYNNYRTFIQNQIKITEDFVKANPNIQKIDNRIKKWNSFRSKLQDWENVINDYTSRNSKLIDEVNNELKTWSVTYDNASKNKAPAELLSYVVGIRDSLRNVGNTLTKETSKFLQLEAKVDKTLWKTTDAIELLESLKTSKTYHLLYRRHGFLWDEKAVDASSEVSGNDDGKTNLKSYKNTFLEVVDQIESEPSAIITFILVVVAITFLVKYLRRSFIKFPLNDESTRLEKFEHLLLKQPLLIMVFVSLLVARMFYLNDSEKFVLDLLITAMLFVSIPMIKAYEPKEFRMFFIGILAFFLIDSFKTYAWFTALQYRLYLLTEACIALVILLYFSKTIYFQHQAISFGGFTRMVKKLSPVVSIFLLISIISNLFGYTNLTDITLMISIQMGIIGMLFYTTLLITESGALSIIHRHYRVNAIYDLQERKLLEKKVIKSIRFLIASITIVVFLSIINQLNPIYEFLQIELSEEYSIGSITFTLGNILLFFVILGISIVLSSIISFLINEGSGALRVFNLAEGIPTAISVILRYVIIGFGFILAISALGIDLSTFNLMAGALGLGIGFGLQTIISNFVSGIILIFERPILPGDSVQIDELYGTVSKIGTRASVISTYDGAEVIVPNNNLITNDLINWTLSNNVKRIEIKIGTAYGSDPNKVLRIIKDAASSNQFVLNEPEPMALFDAFGDSSLNFILRFWVHFENGLQAKSDVSIAIYNGLHEANIEIPFPQRDLNIKNVDPTKTEEFKPLIPPNDNS